LLWRAETGGDLAELEHLERLVQSDFGNASALAVAVDRARAAADSKLPTRAGQRARLLLDMLGEAVGRRGGPVNARGGSA
ncbi:MAG TPA: hypothetical protein VHB21_21535, partial [Minicystis sp.]|nr:hypothetical protein [Minicystis sp.]